jgi:preprotein translocase subunit SecG
MLDYIFSVQLLWWINIVLYVPACLGLIALVLLQKGKGVGFQGAFGMGGGSEAVFGPRSARSLPQRMTYTMAGLFMFLALVMSTLSGKVGQGSAPELADEGAALESASINQLLDIETPDAATTDAAAAADTATTEDAIGTATETPGAAAAPEESEGTDSAQ